MTCGNPVASLRFQHGRQSKIGIVHFADKATVAKPFHLQQAPNHPSMRQPTLEIEVSV
jgi:hypothetical protein